MQTKNINDVGLFPSIEELKPEYINLLKNAMKEGLAAVKKAKESGGYIGAHYDFPNLSYSKNGLPYLSSSLYAGPTDYHSCFNSYNDKPLINEDELTSFKELVDFVRKNEGLQNRFIPDNVNLKKELDKIFIISGIKDCIERYIHTFNSFIYDENNAITASAPTVSYIFDGELNIDIAIPILFAGFEFDSYCLSDGVYIEKIPESQHKARHKVKSYNASAHQQVINAATHALVLKNWSVPNSESIWTFNILSNARAYPIDIIDKFFGAFRIVTAVDTGYAQLYSIANGWAAHCTADLPYLQGVTLRSYPSWFEDFHWNVESIPMFSDTMINEVKTTFNILLKAKENSIDLALKRLNRCLIRDNEEDAVLDATIALEALLSDGNQEMTHKLALRVGALSKLDTISDREPSKAFSDIKNIYNYRSAIVHGSKNTEQKRIIKLSNEKSTTAHALAVDYLRMVLLILLKNEKYRTPTNIDFDLLLCPLNA